MLLVPFTPESVVLQADEYRDSEIGQMQPTSRQLYMVHLSFVYQYECRRRHRARTIIRFLTFASKHDADNRWTRRRFWFPPCPYRRHNPQLCGSHNPKGREKLELHARSGKTGFGVQRKRKVSQESALEFARS
jgi:hypothetical protein